MPPSPATVEALTFSVLRQIARDFPECSVPDALSATLTIARSLIDVTLESQNDEHNRSEILRCLGELEQVVWDRAPKSVIN